MLLSIAELCYKITRHIIIGVCVMGLWGIRCVWGVKCGGSGVGDPVCVCGGGGGGGEGGGGGGGR